MDNDTNGINQMKESVETKEMESSNKPEEVKTVPVGSNGQPNNGPRPDCPNGQPMNGPRPDGPNGQPMNGPRPNGPNGQPMNGPRPNGPNGQPMNGPRPNGPNGRPMNGPRPAGPNGQPMNGPRPVGPNGQPMNGPRPNVPNGQPMNGPRPVGPNGQPMNGPRPNVPNGQPMNGPRPVGPNGQPMNGPDTNVNDNKAVANASAPATPASATSGSTGPGPAPASPASTGQVVKVDDKSAKKAVKKGIPVNKAGETSTNNKSDKPVLIGSVGKAGQYIGMCLMMFAFVLMVPLVSQTGERYLTENILMTFVIALCMVLATVGYMSISVILTAGAIVAFAAYKIYLKFMLQSDFYLISYLWVIIPIIALGGISLFINGYTNLQLENMLLKKQVSELVMIDPITGLYNLRSMFMDIQTQISYSERNNTQISLMIVRLRYPAEMKKVLKQKEYDTVIKQLSLLLADSVRLEDKVYSIDDNGGFGVILTCGTEGTKIVEKRIRSKLADPKWFSAVSPKRKIRAEVKIGYLQYDKVKYDKNANSFKESVEKVVECDV